MNNLSIIQSKSSTEQVTSSVIEKLYQLALTSKAADPSNSFTMNLQGNISVPAAYEDSVVYLRQKFPNLNITVQDNNFYIRFADSEVERVLIASDLCSDHTGFSTTDANLTAKIPKLLFQYNTNIYTFNEFNRFANAAIDNGAFYQCSNLTSINLSNVSIIGNEAFRNCTSLSQDISIPNLTSLGNSAFRNCTSIQRVTNLGTVITELKYDLFRCCTSLQSITVPQQIVSIGNSAFTDCSNLTSFDFSNILSIGGGTFNNTGLSGELNIPNLISLGNGAFQRTNITSITNLGTITAISPTARIGYSEGTFQDCTSLTSIVIPPTVTTIGASSFDGCSNLVQIQCTWENITFLGNGAFSGRPDWNFIINFANLTKLGSNAFGSRSSRGIRQIYFPKMTTTQRDSYYSSNSYYDGDYSSITSDLIYLRDIQKLYPGTFSLTTCSNLVINNTTPPVWCNTNDESDAEASQSHSKSGVFAGSNITNIYVPDSAVTTYQNNADWSSLASKIKPLSQLAKVATEADLQSGQIALIEAYM